MVTVFLGGILAVLGLAVADFFNISECLESQCGVVKVTDGVIPVTDCFQVLGLTIIACYHNQCRGLQRATAVEMRRRER